VPPGRYRVRLHFAEVYYREAGKRRFDVLLEGKLVLEAFEPVAFGFARARAEERDVTLEDGLLEIQFVAGIDSPKVSAIEVECIQY
jgi:hypothetical protein